MKTLGRGSVNSASLMVPASGTEIAYTQKSSGAEFGLHSRVTSEPSLFPLGVRLLQPITSPAPGIKTGPLPSFHLHTNWEHKPHIPKDAPAQDLDPTPTPPPRSTLRATQINARLAEGFVRAPRNLIPTSTALIVNGKEVRRVLTGGHETSCRFVTETGSRNIRICRRFGPGGPY